MYPFYQNHGRKCTLRAKIGHFLTIFLFLVNFLKKFVLKNAIKSLFSHEQVEKILDSSLNFHVGAMEEN